MKTDMELRQEISHAEKVVRHLRRQLRERKRKAHGEPKRKKGMGVRIGDRDDALKAARGYTDPSTYVRRDGSEKLVGRDWVARVEELAERSGGRCEQAVAIDIGEYERCNYCAVDPQHKVKRSLRRDDRLSNLEHLCRLHHDMAHPEFKTQFTRRSGKVGA